MWLCYAAGYLEKAEHDVELFDAVAAGLSINQITAALGEFVPGMIVLDTSTPSIYNDIEVGEELKRIYPNAFTVLVGVHVSALPLETLSLSPQIDAVAFGEYDETLCELASVLSESGRDTEPLLKVRGLAFRDTDGAVHKNESRPFIEDLDNIPFVSQVYHRHLDIDPYFYSHSRHPIVTLVTGRGCHFRCTYCVYPQTLQGHKYRKRSIESIVQEFLYIRDNFPDVKEIMIEDDTLTADKKRCRELSEALIATGGHRIPWSANSRPDVDYDTMCLMHKAGCRLLCVGFESGDQTILDNLERNITLDKIYDFTANARRAGILIHGCFMAGNRGETRESLQKTLKFAKELNPDTAQFYPIMVYPGTSDYKHFKEKGCIVSDDFRKWLTIDGLHSSVVSDSSLTYEELSEFCDRARKEFYLRPAYIFSKLRQMTAYPPEAKRIIKAGLTFIKYLFKRPAKT